MSKKVLLCVLSFGLALICHAHDTTLSTKIFLDLHNAARREVGVGPLEWNSTLEAYARNYAHARSNGCEQVHSNGPYGENITGALVLGSQTRWLQLDLGLMKRRSITITTPIFFFFLMTCQNLSRHMTYHLSNWTLNGRLLTEFNKRCNLKNKKSQGAKMKIFEVRGPK